MNYFLRFLLEKKVINNDLYSFISSKIEDPAEDIDKIIMSVSGVSLAEIAMLKAQCYGMPYTNIESFSKIPKFDYNILMDRMIIPFDMRDGIAHVAISNPDDIEAMDMLRSGLSSITDDVNVKYYIAPNDEIKHRFMQVHSGEEDGFNSAITYAINSNASDIHITPFEDSFNITMRIDGCLNHFKTIAISKFESFAIAVKVMSKLDISETRRPQSGHFQMRGIDFRISTHPTQYGENMVVRVLNRNKSFISIDNLGFSNDIAKYLRRIARFSSGLIIFCGPTGSGKTTSIYSMIVTMDKEQRNIMTLEDPIECKIPNIRQTEIRQGVLNFADGVRSILRQDPDVILIGEIRDEETAKMAIRASMTGHLVLTTVHANDCYGAIVRLKEFGITETLIADNMIAIISQKLVKRKCLFCDDGCDSCSKTGVSGRVIVSEVLRVDDVLGGMISQGRCRQDITEYATENLGFVSIYEDCRNKYENGLIKKEELENLIREF